MVGDQHAGNLPAALDVGQHAAAHAGTRSQRIEEYRRRFDNPYVAAGYGYIDDVIDPKDTRRHLVRHLRVLENNEQRLPFKKHGNMPL